MNGEAVYRRGPWKAQRDPAASAVWYTASKDRRFVYAFFLRWPADHTVILSSLRAGKASSMRMLGYKHQLLWTALRNKTLVYLPTRYHDLWSRKVWMLKATGIE